MEFRHPLEVYTKLCSILFPSSRKHLTVKDAQKKLEGFFSCYSGSTKTKEGTVQEGEAAKQRRRIFVVLLDEIDYMFTQQQTVLYNFFDWPYRSLASDSSPRLIVIGVSNTQNLPERLHPRLQSRIGSDRVLFNSYNVEETIEILKAKINHASKEYKVFEEDAIKYAAKKTGGTSGDLRKALILCHNAAEMVFFGSRGRGIQDDESSRPIVRIQDVMNASRDPTNEAYIACLAQVSSHQALVFLAIALLMKNSIGQEAGGFYVDEIHTKMQTIGDLTGRSKYTPAPDVSTTMDIVNRLCADDMLKLVTPRDSTFSSDAVARGCLRHGIKISLPFDVSTLLLGLKRSAHIDLAMQHISHTF
jgi:origin recognition complex subunit 1